MTKRWNLIAPVAIIWMAAIGCTSDPNSPGLEYMPDMYRSPAVEAYVDYGQDPYYVGEDMAVEQRNTPSSRIPVKGTIPYRGKEGKTFGLPYPYPNTVEGYEMAGDSLTSPINMTLAHIEQGKVLYNQMCSQCHGEKGKGDGAIATRGKIEGIPSYSDGLKDLPVGKMYHTLQYGKGLMGSHASQLSQKQRWMIIQYVQVLQNDGKMPEFDAQGIAVEPVATDTTATNN